MHDGSDEELRQQIAALEDERDRELLEVEAARGFALERIEREYQEEKRLADKEYQVYIPLDPSDILLPKFGNLLLALAVFSFVLSSALECTLTSRWARKKAKTNS